MAADDVGKRMQVIRTKKSLTQIEVGQALGVSPIVIHQYEAGKSRVPLAIIERFSQLYSVKYTYLIDGEDDTAPFLPPDLAGPLFQAIIEMLTTWQVEAGRALEPAKLKALIQMLLDEGKKTGEIDPARARQLFDLAA
jgi:transcriptional regulator with XRE-family HTH domain